MVLGAMVMVALATDPAQGSAVGPFLYADVDGSFLASPLEGRPAVSPSTGVVGGIGVEVAHFRLVPTVSFGVWQRTPLLPDQPLNFAWVFSTALSATDLVHERHTGLRLSPVIGFSHAATRLTQAPSTLLNAGFALERRFGPVEIAWRPRGRYYFSSYRCEAGGICVEPEWELANSVWLEGWVLPQLSVGGGLNWTATWGDVPYFTAVTGSPTPSSVRDFFAKLFGEQP